MSAFSKGKSSNDSIVELYKMNTNKKIHNKKIIFFIILIYYNNDGEHFPN